MITKNYFFLEILKAVCLSVVWVPKLIQKSCPTMEQKLVKRSKSNVNLVAFNYRIRLLKPNSRRSHGAYQIQLLLREDIQNKMSRSFGQCPKGGKVSTGIQKF